MAFLDIVLGAPTQGTEAEQKEEGKKASNNSCEETEWTHGWIRRWSTPEGSGPRVGRCMGCMGYLGGGGASKGHGHSGEAARVRGGRAEGGISRVLSAVVVSEIGA